MNKALIVTNTASMVHLFNDANIDLLQRGGYEVHIACNFLYGNTASEDAIEEYKKKWKEKGVVAHQIGFLRSPFSLKMFSIYQAVKNVIKCEKFDVIHCHTPIVSVLVRLAARKERKKGTNIIYTAHGFHFFKGAPLFNWLLYYPAEWLMSFFTDHLITITREDYERASKHFKARHIHYIQGVGVDTRAIAETSCDRDEMRKELGVNDEEFLVLSVGEINNNKNHREAIKALSLCNSNIKYMIAGIGSLKEELEELARELGVYDRVKFLGFRTDVYKLLQASDIMVHPSHREGLSVAIMEAMASRLPIIATDTRGNGDLIDEGLGGFLIAQDDAENLAKALDRLCRDGALCKKMGEYNFEKIKDFDKTLVVSKLNDIFFEIEGRYAYTPKEVLEV